MIKSVISKITAINSDLGKKSDTEFIADAEVARLWRYILIFVCVFKSSRARGLFKLIRDGGSVSSTEREK